MEHQNATNQESPSNATATEIDIATIDIDKIDINSPEIQPLLSDYKPPEAGFDKIGFARPLGGFFYEFFYAMLGGILIVATFGILLSVLYPYPDAKGYTSVGNILFSFLFFVANIPTSFALERFVAEWRIKNPGKMIEYIRFYVWYQMMTGILLVTVTSIYVLYILQTGNLVYTKWLLLVYIAREYPAMSGVFIATLKGLQQFQYMTKVNFIAQSFFQPVCELLCVLAGRFILGRIPMFGEIMGIAIGYAVGTYIDDFFSMGMAMHYLNKVLKPIGFTVWDTFIPHIRKEVWKESLIFGLKLSPPGILESLLSLFTFFWWYDMVPQYATLLVLNETADSLANLVRRGGGIYLKGTMSESLNNGKRKLTAYYVSMALKFSFMTMAALAVILYAFMPIILEVVLLTGDLENWVLAIAFITPNIIASTLEQPTSIAKDVILGGNRPTWYSSMDVYEKLTGLGLDYLLLFVLKIPQNLGIEALVWIIPLKSFPVKLSVLIMDWVYIQKKLIKVHFKDFAWQTWGAPVFAVGSVFLVSAFWFNIVYPPMLVGAGPYVTAGITVLIAFICLLWVYFPIYTMFGGWDTYGINIFSEAVDISGPSRLLFKPIVWVNKLMIRSKLHNRFPIPWEDADREAGELMRERFVKDKILKMRNAATV